MTKPLTVLLRGACAASLAMASLSAPAALLTLNAGFSLNQKDILATVANASGSVTSSNTGPRDSSQVLTFSQFNSGLGTLQGVTITLTSSQGATTSVKAQMVPGVDAVQLFSFKADGSMVGQLTGLAGLFSASFSGTPSSTCAMPLAGPSCESGPDTSGGAVDKTSNYTSALAPFIGGGSFDLTASLSSALAPKSIPDNGSSFVDNASMEARMSNIQWAGTVSVTYDYLASTVNQAPEAMSLYLVLAGLGAMAWRRRQG